MSGRGPSETVAIWPWIAQRLEMGHWRTALSATRSGAQKRERIKWKTLH